MDVRPHGVDSWAQRLPSRSGSTRRRWASATGRLWHDLSGGDQEQRREFCQQRAVSGYTRSQNGVTATAGGQTLHSRDYAVSAGKHSEVDLNNLAALGKNAAVTVPNGLKIEKIESNGAVPPQAM